MKKITNLNGMTFMMITVICILLLSGCANSESVVGCVHGHTYGFWGGLWHGIIAPVDLVIMLFKNNFIADIFFPAPEYCHSCPCHNQ